MIDRLAGGPAAEALAAGARALVAHGEDTTAGSSTAPPQPTGARAFVAHGEHHHGGVEHGATTAQRLEYTASKLETVEGVAAVNVKAADPGRAGAHFDGHK